MIGLVTSADMRSGKKGPYLSFDLKTPVGSEHIMIFRIPNVSSPKLPRKGDYIQFELDGPGVRDQRHTDFKSISLEMESFVKIDAETLDPDLKETLSEVPKASDEDMEEAYKNILDRKLYKHPTTLALVELCLKKVAKDFYRHPAAKSVHHACVGGLIVHTSQVLTICKGIVSTFPWAEMINTDLVYAGATLHDIGKTKTYGFDEIGMPTKRATEDMIGHIFCSMDHIIQTNNELKTPVSEQFLNELLHIIASHHGTKEFGTIKEPGTPEAYIVSLADYLGSRMGIIETKIESIKKKKSNQEETWTDYKNKYIMSETMKGLLDG